MTKLYIPYNVSSTGIDEYLIVRSPLRMRALTVSLLSKLLVVGLSSDECLVLFWLGEKLKPLDKAKVYFCLTLFWETKITGGILNLFPDWYWSHQNLDKRFIQLKGNLKQQATRLCKQLKITLKRERREKAKPIELRRLGVGYRDKGSLSNYNFHWKDVPGNVQVIYQDLFVRLTDAITKSHIQKAITDLSKFSQVSASRRQRRLTPKRSDESLGKETKPVIRKPKVNKLSSLLLLFDYLVRETESSF